MTSPIPQSAADQGASPHAPAAEVATSSNPPGSTSPLIEPALTVTFVPGWVSEIADEQAAEVEAGCPVSVAIERAVMAALALPPGHRPHDWSSTPEPQPPHEQRVWHTEGRGSRNVYVTSWLDTHQEPSVNLNLIGGTHFDPDTAERIADDIKAAAADARARFGTKDAT